MFDALIVGGGPCGVSTAIYLKRANVNVAIIEKSYIGGQIGKSSELANYAGYIENDTFVFCDNLKKQLKSFDIQVIRDTAIGIDVENKNIFGKKGTYQSKAIILCIGADEVKLDLPNVDNYLGGGVSYCAVCDGNFYKDKTVCVLGSGNTAVEDAIYLSKLAKVVHIIYRKDTLKAERFLITTMDNQTVKNGGNIVEHKCSTVTGVFGENKLDSVEITNVNTGDKSILKTDGLFLCIGRKPNLQFLDNKIEISSSGYIKVDDKFQTSVKGVFAGGDCIEKTVRQVVTAVADGAIISKNVLTYLDEIG